MTLRDFRENKAISEAYSGIAFVFESDVVSEWDAKKRNLRSNIIRYERTVKFPLGSRYDWELDTNILKDFGISQDEGFSFLGGGAGRDVYSTPFGTVLKIAVDSSGIAQNIEEYTDKSKKNSIGCFPSLIWKSPKGMVIEEEMVETYDTDDEKKFLDDFRILNGLEFNTYIQVLKHYCKDSYMCSSNMRMGIDDESVNLRFAFEKIHHPTNESQRNLMLFTDYILTRNDSVMINETCRFDNWGKTVKNGYEVLLPVDIGGSKRIINKYYSD